MRPYWSKLGTFKVCLVCCMSNLINKQTGAITMYINNAVINVLGNEYDKNNKPFTITTHEFKFNDGIIAKDLAKFLENLHEDHAHRLEGSVMATITIDARDYK
jgi:hypothetical protein